MVQFFEELLSSDMKRDFETKNITSSTCFNGSGYVGNRPSDFKGDFHEDDTWAIDTLEPEPIAYLYVSEYEYKHDLQLLSKMGIDVDAEDPTDFE